MDSAQGELCSNLRVVVHKLFVLIPKQSVAVAYYEHVPRPLVAVVHVDE